MEEKKILDDKMDEDKSQEMDVYSLIRSAEIRDYYRKEDIFGIFEKEQLILHAFISVQQKAVMLKHLAKTGTVEENSRIDEMYRLYCKYIDMIYHPSVRTIFILECNEVVWDEEVSDVGGHSLGGAYDTVDEVATEMESIYGDKESRCRYGGMGYASVTALQVPQNGKVKEAFRFTMYKIDGKWEIKDLSVNDEDLEMQGISEDTVQRFNDYSLYHPLPFENGSRLKLQLPSMKEPVYGSLESELDGNGCWYHFFYGEKERGDFNMVMLTDAEINLTSGYSSLDWIERA
ncbi:MAG: hypothetical protein HDR18_16545 [Lachnospiraceae bacterium]|nr:hypothetical protein [Lachnospiraceae bacterium]